MNQKFNRMVRAYLNIREARSTLKNEYAARDNDLKNQLGRIETAMLEALNESGAESVRTEFGTAYTQTTTKAAIADWSAFSQWEDAIEFMERRVKASMVREYLDECGELPPGVNIYNELNVRIRKS